MHLFAADDATLDWTAAPFRRLGVRKSTVTIQNSEVTEVSKQTFEQGVAAPAPAPAPAPGPAAAPPPAPVPAPAAAPAPATPKT